METATGAIWGATAHLTSQFLVSLPSVSVMAEQIPQVNQYLAVDAKPLFAPMRQQYRFFQTPFNVIRSSHALALQDATPASRSGESPFKDTLGPLGVAGCVAFGAIFLILGIYRALKATDPQLFVEADSARDEESDEADINPSELVMVMSVADTEDFSAVSPSQDLSVK